MSLFWICVGVLILAIGAVILDLMRDKKKRSDPKDDNNDHLNDQHFDPH